MTKTFAAVLASAVIALNSANAAIVFGNLGASGTGAIQASGGINLNSTTWRAIGFTAGGTDLVLNTATIGVFVNNTGKVNMRVDLYSNNAGLPGTSLANTTQTIDANTLDQPITFTLNRTLTAGTTYWIVAQRTGGAGNSSALVWRPADGLVVPTTQNASGWLSLGNNTAVTSLNDGASWGSTGNGSSSSISLSASAAPIPEPGTWAAMAIFAGGAAYAGWRRRQQQLA
jgi:hypothetical protein